MKHKIEVVPPQTFGNHLISFGVLTGIRDAPFTKGSAHHAQELFELTFADPPENRIQLRVNVPCCLPGFRVQKARRSREDVPVKQRFVAVEVSSACRTL